VIGHTNHFVKKPHGFERSWRNVEEMKKKFVPSGVEMIRLNIPLSNPEGNGKLLLIFDPGIKYYINFYKYSIAQIYEAFHYFYGGWSCKKNKMEFIL